jgi:hypothetical protein
MDGRSCRKDKREAEGGLIFGTLSFRRFDMQIYVGKNGQQLGPFSLEEVNRKLADQTFSATDLAWYEGAAGWAPLSSVAGVVIPQTPAAAPAPAAVPVAAPASFQPAPAPIRPNTPIVQSAKSPTKTLSIVTWSLLGITFFVSFIPIVGCGAWALGIPVALTAIILGIVMMTRGGTGGGIMAILGGILIVPLCFLAQFLSLMVFGGTVERKEQTQIRENLLLIDSAKTKWVAETKAADGTPVTMASLKSQLGGKEVKPEIGETYDPMPVGQPPTATLPANKTLGSFAGGDVLTAASIETALANSSAFNWSVRKSSTTTPLTIPAPSVSPKPVASAAPSVTVSPTPPPSPRPSASPRTSNTPHSLISPRQQQEEPDESPSSRPGPTAKFAPPQKAPQMKPRQSPPASDNSGAPRQGKQRPPGEAPSPSPDDDDDD